MMQLKPFASRRTWSLSALLAATVFLLFQNCGQFVPDPNAFARAVSFASTGGTDLQPATDKIDPSCMGNLAYDACLFRKNPVAQKGAGLGATAQSNALDSLQVYGVKLTGLSTSGRLENSAFHIETVRGSPVSTFGDNLKVRAVNDGGHKFAQIMTYYWLERTAEYIDSRTETLPVRDKKIAVYIDDSIAGWSPKTNSIHLKLEDNGALMALNADLAIHFFGVANLYHASSGAISTLGASAKHKDCGLRANGCCTSQAGCARAIESGVGDYFVAMMFPDQPTVGETWVDSVTGLGFCNQSRDLRQASTRTAQAAFDACGAGGTGEVATLGTIYASIWWEVRKAAGEAGSKDIDTLFMLHLSSLTGDDDFKTALEKIKSIDSQRFGGKYTPLFIAQYSARGL